MLDQIKNMMPFKRGDTTVKRNVPLETANPLARMDRDLQQMLERFQNYFQSPSGGNGLESWFGDFSPMTFVPNLDVADKPKHLAITVELPGMDAKDIEIDARDGALVIRGEKKSEETTKEDGFYRTERSFGSFERTIPLPTEVDAEKSEASFKNGVLEIRLPKTKPVSKAKKIAIAAK